MATSEPVDPRADDESAPESYDEPFKRKAVQ